LRDAGAGADSIPFKTGVRARFKETEAKQTMRIPRILILCVVSLMGAGFAASARADEVIRERETIHHHRYGSEARVTVDQGYHNGVTLAWGGHRHHHHHHHWHDREIRVER
jgi:hypothetical protein